ncbi:zinc-dependent alcohol dehydrogenase [Paraburkholderia phenoliruptrix]|uniref:zinc-dependent alcohol dehydrogenase n=1 Tax=Paraburkholderia phenoliruptrix TaxID=252970 RepID=UPI0028699065|nr:alcohol dehydrogenase catalytic domain-containing protein [Paraburkholderia phenoliruptrix]WMY07507.1 alcohol dehydrogenase catalytic domain-containing protein [Paraburkholderia phenoliruptrix]
MMSERHHSQYSASGTMKGAIHNGIRSMAVIDVPRPDVLPGTVIVKINVAGICGSDLGSYRTVEARSGVPTGHEVSGTIVAIGEGITNLSVGERVTIDMVLGTACGTCQYCQRGFPIHCRARTFPFGGGFAEYVRTKGIGAFPLPDSVDDNLGALVEPIAVAVHAARVMKVKPGMVGVIVGAGAIGLAALAAVTYAGSERVYVVAKHPEQVSAALDLGAAGIISMDEHEAIDAINEITGGLGADYAIETVGGTANTLRLACQLVRPLGMLGVIGTFDRGFKAIELIDAHVKELGIYLANCYGCIDGVHDFQVAIDLLAQNGTKMKRLITTELPLVDVDQAFRLAADKTSNSIKVQMRVSPKE